MDERSVSCQLLGGATSVDQLRLRKKAADRIVELRSCSYRSSLDGCTCVEAGYEGDGCAAVALRRLLSGFTRSLSYYVFTMFRQFIRVRLPV